MLNRDNATILLMIDFADKIQKIASRYDSAQNFVHDSKNFDAALLVFLILGESVAKLSQKFKEQNNSIHWRNVESYKNLGDFDFMGYDENKIWNIIQNELPKLKEKLSQLQ